jgi:hypothetical protein
LKSHALPARRNRRIRPSSTKMTREYDWERRINENIKILIIVQTKTAMV